MRSVVKKLIPRPIRESIQTYWENRQKVQLFANLAPLVPPIKLLFEGPQSYRIFKTNGEDFLKIYRSMCGLRRDEKMLDVGCGIGRKTLPLTQYFNGQARYQGIDITKVGVDWCRGKITPQYPNFQFQLIDVYNKLYHPTGRLSASQYRFPFGNESFTFVVLGSVFTHMMPEDLETYLAEVHRVLMSGERCLVSYFLLTEQSHELSAGGKSTLDFKNIFDGYRAVSRDLPELAVAFEEQWIFDLYEKVGLKITRLEYGSWCGRENAMTYQDLILAEKS